MKIDLKLAVPSQVETECLVVVTLDHGTTEKPAGKLASADQALLNGLAEAAGDMTGKALESTLLYKLPNVKARRVLVMGGGKAGKFSPNDMRNVAGAAARALKPRGVRSLAIVLPEGTKFHDDNLVRAAVIGALVGDFDPDTYKSDRKDQSIQAVTVVADPKADQKLLTAALDEARIIGESQNFTRTLVNEPGNRMTPTILAQRAEAMCKEVGLACKIHGPEAIRGMKMGAFWSVSQGSDEEPRLIEIHYEPQGAPAEPKIGLVGKGITFDTGGISIKPADGMEKMKYDMAGGAAMLGAMRAIALLKPKVRVVALVCASENMPSGKAQKPGDVQIAMNGKSIEIINTDAEGRLVLADGLCYARQLGATHLVDAATLTGACVVALGMVNAGIFSNNDELYGRFEKALHQSGEKMWRLPVDEEYREIIRSSIADIVNSGGRWGGAVTAAMFLKEFVEDKPWIHLDIAGVAWMEENKPYIAKGPSGIAVRSVIELVRGFES
jgi:leucyl aminopeptidase